MSLAYAFDVDRAAVVKAMGFLQQVLGGFANLDASRKTVAFHALSAIYEAATVDVLCADETGTLTRNELWSLWLNR